MRENRTNCKNVAAAPQCTNRNNSSLQTTSLYQRLQNKSLPSLDIFCTRLCVADLKSIDESREVNFGTGASKVCPSILISSKTEWLVVQKRAGPISAYSSSRNSCLKRIRRCMTCSISGRDQGSPVTRRHHAQSDAHCL